jgi:hypothetical protein
MKLNCDAMDPDAEWVNTMQSSSCRVHKTGELDISLARCGKLCIQPTISAS